MALVNRPDFSIKWAEAGNVLEPATEKRELGHVVEKPPYEIVNWIENNQDNGIAYLMQEGISEWSLDQDYSATSYVKYDGVVYRAKVASIGKQPDTQPSVWEIAFVDYTDYTDLSQDLYDTKNTAGHAANLVYKNAPVMTARADGTSYKADVGTSLTPTDNVGYVFDGKETDGIFHDGERVVVQKNGLVVAEFGDPTVNNNDDQVVTKAYLKKFLELYSVGDLYVTTRNGNPTELLGYGTWERYGQGKVLVGFSEASTTNPTWTKFIGNEFGNYDEKLTLANLPNVNNAGTITLTQHYAGDDTTGNGVFGLAGRNYRTTLQENVLGAQINLRGGDQAHNNVQPSVVVYMWLRTK